MKEKKIYFIIIMVLVISQISLMVVLDATIKMNDSSTNQTIEYIKSIATPGEQLNNMINVEVETNYRFKKSVTALVVLLSFINVLAITAMGSYHNKYYTNNK